MIAGKSGLKCATKHCATCLINAPYQGIESRTDGLERRDCKITTILSVNLTRPVKEKLAKSFEKIGRFSVCAAKEVGQLIPPEDPNPTLDSRFGSLHT